MSPIRGSYCAQCDSSRQAGECSLIVNIDDWVGSGLTASTTSTVATMAAKPSEAIKATTTTLGTLKVALDLQENLLLFLGAGLGCALGLDEL